MTQEGVEDPRARPAIERSMSRGESLALSASLLLFVTARQVTWSLINPLFQGPDEVVHIQMVSQLDKNGLAFYRLANPQTWRDVEASYDFNEDWYHQKGVIWHLDLKPTYSERSRWGLDEQSNLHRPHFADSDTPNPYHEGYQSYLYPPLYYWLIAKMVGILRVLGVSLIGYQYGMRLVQAVFYVAFVIAAFWLAEEVIQDRLILLWTCSCILFHPMFIFMGSVVNNDNGLMPFAALLLLGATRLLKHPDRHAPIWLTTIAALCLALVKASGFLLVLAVFPMLAVLLTLSKRLTTTFRLLPGFISCCALFVILPKWIGQYGLYGGNPGKLSAAHYMEIIFGWLGWNMARNWFGQFAWFEVNFPVPVYVGFIVLLACFVVASLVYLPKALAKRDYGKDSQLFLFLFTTFFAVVLGAFVHQYLIAPKYGLIIQGRHILYALPIAYLCSGMLFARGIYQARSWLIRVGNYLLATGILLGLFSLSIAGLWLIIHRFFWDPGISPRELLNRMMQYKPAFVKSNLGFTALAGSYLVGHIVVLTYWVWSNIKLVGRISTSPSVR